MAESLTGPEGPMQLKDAFPPKPMPDGFFNQVRALANDVAEEARRIGEQIGRIEAARDGR
jgi:hypothetical protein